MIWCLALLLFVGAPSKGDEPQATVLEAVRTILEQRPAEARRLFQTYDFDSVGHSPYLGGDKVDAALRGRRVGPYTLYARPKGAAGPAQWKIIIKTEIQYRDSRGQPVDIFQAKSVAENFQGVTVVELEAPDPQLFGRWRTERIEGPWKAFYRSVEWQFGEDLTFTARYFTLEGEKATEGHFEISRGRLLYGSRARNTWGIVDLVIESADRLRVSQPGPDGTSSVWVFRRVR